MQAARARLSDFALTAADGDFPAQAREIAVDAIVDLIACVLVGNREPIAPALQRSLALSPSRTPACSAGLWGTALFASPYDAALYHGAVGHALDYDDMMYSALLHGSTVIVPALFALAGEPGVTGKDVVSAFIVGTQVAGRLGRALQPEHAKRGWHSTSTIGTIAAAAAAARLLRLSPEKFDCAVGLAASAASGIFANLGTMTAQLHGGYAARNAALAALLARGGVTASRDALTHAQGFAQTFNFGDATARAEVTDWGPPLEVLADDGISLKRFSSAVATHTAIEAGIKLHGRIGDGIANVKDVRVGVAEMAKKLMTYPRPADGTEAKFSIEYGVAAGLLDGDVTLASFTDAQVNRPEVGALLDRIRVEVDDRLRLEKAFPAIAVVTLNDGTRHEEFVPFPIGHPKRRLSKQAIEAKFVDCARRVLRADAVEPLFAALRGLDGAVDLEPILDGLTRIA